MSSNSAASTALAVALLVVFVGVAGAYAARIVRSGRQRDTRLSRLGRSPFLGSFIVESFYWAMHVPGRAFVRLGISANAITWTALVLSIASAPAAASGRLALAGTLVLVGALLDALDGMVARETGNSSRAGQLLDSVLDRYADAAPLVGLTLLYRFSVPQMLVPLLAIVGATMLSYVRAKGEALALDLPSGAMRRHERVVYVGAGFIFGPIFTPYLGAPYGILHPVTLGTVALVAVVSNVAAVKLFAHARATLSGTLPTDAAVALTLTERWLRLRAWLNLQSDVRAARRLHDPDPLAPRSRRSRRGDRPVVKQDPR